MHNWLEGILEHHLRVLWGVGRDKAHEEKVKERDVDELWSESDISESGSELEELRREVEEFNSRSVVVDFECCLHPDFAPKITDIITIQFYDPRFAVYTLTARNSDSGLSCSSRS